MILIAALVAPAVLLIQDTAPPAATPTQPGYAQSAVCMTLARIVTERISQVERNNGPTPESQALAGQAHLLSERATARLERARIEEGLSDEQGEAMDQLVASRLAEADRTQFENGVLNCFALFGVD